MPHLSAGALMERLRKATAYSRGLYSRGQAIAGAGNCGACGWSLSQQSQKARKSQGQTIG
jgi:hypothetical protein